MTEDAVDTPVSEVLCRAAIPFAAPLLYGCAHFAGHGIANTSAIPLILAALVIPLAVLKRRKLDGLAIGIALTCGLASWSLTSVAGAVTVVGGWLVASLLISRVFLKMFETVADLGSMAG